MPDLVTRLYITGNMEYDVFATMYNLEKVNLAEAYVGALLVQFKGNLTKAMEDERVRAALATAKIVGGQVATAFEKLLKDLQPK